MPASTLNRIIQEEPWRLRNEEKPLRAEAFSEDHLAEHARELGWLLHEVQFGGRGHSFLERFAENAEFLRDSIGVVAAAAREGLALRPDAEWLLDNFYIVEEQLREIHDDLPHRYYRELPKTKDGEPRVYTLAVELVTHTDSVLDEEGIVRFVSEFQTVTPLSMGEIWAVPIMLRLVLTENLRRIAAQMLSGHASERKAKQIVGDWEEGSDFPMDLSPIEECGSLVFHVIDKLQQEGATYLERIRELEKRLSAFDLTLQQSIHLEHQRQASSQVSIGNVITSMRLISAIDWAAFFERTNLAEQVLRRDPAGIYAMMDYESRDRYRHVVEDLSGSYDPFEIDVAEAVVKLANNVKDTTSRARHIGYWLEDKGREQLEATIGFRPRIYLRPFRWLKRHPNLAYLGSIILFTLLLVAGLDWLMARTAVSTVVQVVVLLLAILPASEFAVSLTNTLMTSSLKPRLLAKLNFKAGIPAGHRTVVVVPCMLSNSREIASLLQRLEMHYLANPDPSLSFALLTDFPDAAERAGADDQARIDQAVAGIRELNLRHAPETDGPFFLFHRTRQWNEQERAWMGWERKRGKLMEFNRWLRGDDQTSYIVQEGSLDRLRPANRQDRIRFVITLDADTTLPHDAARRLIATLAHPLNTPVFDERKHQVVDGYVLLQPRVTVNLSSAETSRFAKLFANNPGIDPYSTSASDVYQDLFGEGSFTGKGIYEIDVFERALEGAFPENQILSHDLIEGCHTRVGLVSDIEVFDNYPPKYEADCKRLHRWVRGDWQIAPWLLPVVPGQQGWQSNRLSLLSRWKILDNLRRSVVAPALILFLVSGWIAVPQLAGWITALGLLVQFYPMLAQLGLALRGWPRHATIIEHLQTIWKDVRRSAIQIVLLTSFLPHKAWLMTDAIVRTGYRMLVSRQKMLEWTTASDVERQLAKASGSTLQLTTLTIVAVVVALMLKPVALLAASPFLVLWCAAPFLLNWLNSPLQLREQSPLTSRDRRLLRLDARRIWAFFEAYVGEKDHWLPPDNIQEYPEEKVAHRISPTNEGLYLMSALVARDFGYLSLHDLVDLWERNLDNWTKFDRLQGHFYNWYDTVTMEPLMPRYVSTVDSGNLAACFLTMQRGIEDLRTSPVVGSFLADGLADSIEMIVQSGELLKLSEDRRVQGAWQQFIKSLHQLQVDGKEDDLLAWLAAIDRWQTCRSDIASKLEPLAASLHGSHQGLLVQIRLLLDWLASVHIEAMTIFPWWPSLSAGLLHQTSGDQGHTVQLRWLPTSAISDQLCSRLFQQLTSATSLVEVQKVSEFVIATLDELRSVVTNSNETCELANAVAWIDCLKASIQAASIATSAFDNRLRSVAAQTDELARAMDFRMLFNPQRKLFSIGYNLETGRLDGSHYDMLCSEARIASFLAIAKGDVEARHWFCLGRPMTEAVNQLALLSWGGTMFEYMMPQLFQHTYEESLLMQSCRTAVARQQEYGRQRGVPWGISECAFGALAANSDYHYRSFGVPGLGLKRGLSKDLVISPYSTMLAIELDPRGAIHNLEKIEKHGGLGLWGLYEALDFTPERVPAGKRSIVVRCYMAHHQGMSMLALGNLLKHSDTRRRFHDHPLVRATELLLQERIPVSSPKLDPHTDEQAVAPAAQVEDEMVSRRIVGVSTALPRLQLMSNGQYHVMITSTGGGYSRCNSLGVTRWRSDVTRDNWGQFFYLRETQSGRVWSATYQPTCVEPSHYEAIYSIDKAEFYRRDGQIETQLEVVVSPENNSELRQLKLINNGKTAREIEITSYVEVSLTEPAADLAHPAFQKLFIETEYVPEKTALLARRRPRESQQPAVWAVHALSAGPEVTATVQFETSRQEFLGRGRTPQQPLALEPGRQLTGTAGAVLDPVFSLRCTVTVAAGESVSVAFMTAMATNRDEAISLADQYRDPRGVQRAFELAWAYSQVELRHLHLSPAKMHLYQRLASAMLYPDRGRRPPANRLKENRQGQRGLWRFGISGTLPLFVVYVSKPEQIDLVREAIGAHLYWKGRGLRTEFVIVNDYPGSYLDAMQDQLIQLLQDLQIRLDDKPAEVFLLRGAQMASEDKLLLDAVASVLLHGDRGSFARQIETGAATPTEPAKARLDKSPIVTSIARSFPSVPSSPAVPRRDGAVAKHFDAIPIKELEFWNGSGGFAKQGREYQIRTGRSQPTPMPWSNVIANPQFGCMITESGGGYTWFGNSRENKLTTWANDPVVDLPSEALYVFDYDSGELCSPLSGVRRDGEEYHVQHGQGYSRYLHRSNGLSHEVIVSIAPDDPVKFVRLTLRNDLQQPRKLSALYYAEWVMGVCREETQMHIATSVDEATGALLVTNHYHGEYPNQVAFLHVLANERSVTGDRTEFFGRNGTLLRPASVGNTRLSGRTGAGFDPCGAIQSPVQLLAGQEIEIIFLIGAANDRATVDALLTKYNSAEVVRQACDETVARWDRILTSIEVKTPDRAFDLIVNRWLVYQVLSCRVWGRSAYYQSGGAFGFRDQLQDVMCLVYSRPDVARQQILTASARQFEEGDVQHWWHPPEGRGTRTRFSDDLLWLPLVVCHYLDVTNDQSVLEEEVGYLHSPPLDEHQQERYDQPGISTQRSNIYEHCRRAIEHGFRVGAHGLPLMGCGDWNDGMNKVGEGGKGESVWVGWFLLVILDRFIPLMRQRGDTDRADALQNRAAMLRHDIEENAWDGEWYRRAYFDDGTPLGSAQNEECQIDSLAQTWSVMAGGDPRRSRQAMEAVMNRLVRWKDGLALLFTPPFNHSSLDPGYIKGYVPGIRENGGQYTHSTAWIIQALTLLNDGDRAMQVFDLVNPVHHALSQDAVLRYQVEPYVVAADVYGVAPHVGRGGWTWYTGSAAWLYRAAVEFVLGFQLRGDHVIFNPKVPANWQEFEFRFRRGDKCWTFRAINESNVTPPMTVSGPMTFRAGAPIPLADLPTSETITVVWSPVGPTASDFTGSPHFLALQMNGPTREWPNDHVEPVSGPVKEQRNEVTSRR